MTYFSASDVGLWVYGLWCVVAIFVTWWLPGMLLTQRLRSTSRFDQALFAWPLGISAWGMLSYVAGYTRAPWLCVFYICVVVVSAGWFAFKQRSWIADFRTLITMVHRRWIATLSVMSMTALACFTQAFPIIGSGLLVDGDLALYQNHAYDDVMHLAFIQSLEKGLPPIHPGSPNLQIVHYHYWSDMVMATLVRTWHLPVMHVFFQYMPLFLSSLGALLAFRVVQRWTGSVPAGVLAIFFSAIASDAAYLFAWHFHHELNFSTPMIETGTGLFFNMPHAFARCLFLACMLGLWYWWVKKQAVWRWPTIIMMATIAGFKVYFALFAAGGLATVIGLQVLQQVWSWLRLSARAHALTFISVKKLGMTVATTLLPLIVFLALFFSIYLPPNHGAGGLFFAPLEWTRIFLGVENLDYDEWWLRRDVYTTAQNPLGIVLWVWVIGGGITTLSIFGSRIFGYLGLTALAKRTNLQYCAFFAAPLLVFFILGHTTLQVSGMFNVYNFFAVSLGVLALLLAVWLHALSQNKYTKVLSWMATLLLICVSVPRTLYDLQLVSEIYQDHFQVTRISAQELAAFAFIRDQVPQDAILQAHVKNEYDQSTPYVPFFSDRAPFLSGTGSLRTHNQPVDARRKQLDEVWNVSRGPELAGRLHSIGVQYIYVRRKPEELYDFSLNDGEFFSTVFENDEVIVAKVQ